MANYYGNRGNGSSLRHYRTKGSRNGYSKNPNYKVVGQKAEGRLVNGRYVYDTGETRNKPYNAQTQQAMAKVDYYRNQGTQNNWQQQAAAAQGRQTAQNAYNSGKIAGYVNGEGGTAKVHKQELGPKKKRLFGLVTTQDRKENISSYIPAGYTAYNPQLVSNNTVWGGMTKSGGKTKNVDDHFTQVGHQAAQSIMNGQRNNWQQQANAHRAIDDAAKRHAGAANGAFGYDRSYANAVAKNNKNTPEYKAAMRKKVEELSKRGAQQSSVGGHSAAQAQASGILNGRNGLGLRNEKQIQEHYAAKQKTLKGRLDLAKRAANVAMVNAKKKIQKINPLNLSDRKRLSDPITGETASEWRSKGKTKAMTTGTALSLHGPSNTYNTNLVYDTANQTYHPTNLNGMTHLIANSINNSHAPTSNNHAIGGYNAPHTGEAKRQQEAMMRRSSAKGARNDWQKQAASAQANAMAANRVNSGQSQAANVQENKKGFLGILKDKRKTYQMSNKTNKIIGDYVSKKKTESKLTAAEQRRKEDKKNKKLIKKGKKKLNSLLSVLGKQTK